MLRKIFLPLILLQLAVALYAEDEIWIDFNELPSGYVPEDGSYVRQYDPAPIQDDDDTVLDFSNIYDPLSHQNQNLLPGRYANIVAKSGSSAYEDMRLSLALDRWQIEISGSSNLQSIKESTEVVAYRAKDTSSRFAGEQLLAAHFDLPDLLVNSKVWIVPEFAIPPYSLAPGADLQADRQRGAKSRMGQFLGKGVLRNVGPIRSITATVYGRRFPLSFTIEANRTDTGPAEFPMGSLNFSGWQDMVWTNTNYVTDVRKRSYNTNPEYPRGMPSLVLRALRLDRSLRSVSPESAQVVFYIKQIRVVYDNAIPEAFDEEIDDEQIWQLNTTKAQKGIYDEAIRSRLKTVDRYLELQERAPLPAQDTQEEGISLPPSQEPAAN